MKKYTKMTIFGRKWYFYLDPLTRIVIGFHWAECGVTAHLECKGPYDWMKRAWTFPCNHGYDRFFPDHKAFDKMIEYLFWYEKTH